MSAPTRPTVARPQRHVDAHAAAILPTRCGCGGRIDYTTDSLGRVVALPCQPCARLREQAAHRAWRAERVAERRATLAVFGALLGQLYAATVTPAQHQRSIWRRSKRRQLAERKARGLPRRETASQKAIRRAGVAALRADPVYREIERMRRGERAARLARDAQTTTRGRPKGRAGVSV